MKERIVFLLISVLLFALTLITTRISLAEVTISDVPNPGKIQSFIPQPLIDLFNNFNKIDIDFSKFPFLNKVVSSVPKSGQEVAGGFKWLTDGLGNINDWLKSHIGLNIILVIQKVGEFFIWVFQGIANLIRAGLSFIK
jgi:hypothetical protein